MGSTLIQLGCYVVRSVFKNKNKKYLSWLDDMKVVHIQSIVTKIEINRVNKLKNNNRLDQFMATSGKLTDLII